jgi:hypothetical protein
MGVRFGEEVIFSFQEWTSILTLSAMWEFIEIRKIAIDQMFRLPGNVVGKIVIARDFYITEWFVPSLNEYARLDRPISAEDVDHLGLNYLLGIVGARHVALKQHSIPNSRCSACGYREVSGKVEFINETDCTDALRSVFQDEFEGVQKIWSVDRTSTDPPVYVTTRMRESTGMGEQ